VPVVRVCTSRTDCSRKRRTPSNYKRTLRCAGPVVGILALRNHGFVTYPRMINVSESDCLVLPYKRHISSLVHFTADEKHAFADIMSRVTKRYDNLFSCSFAYAMGIHQRPIPPRQDDDGIYIQDGDDIAHLHVHFEPPLLRSASVRKFLAGCVSPQVVHLSG
jgi:UDPglucose--hexose-1-phosphate uridylyltransferase